MCGRFALGIPRKLIAEELNVADHLPLGMAMDRYNVTPGSETAVVVQDGDGKRLEAMRWGLVPAWVKDEKIGWKTISARAETVAQKPAFSAAFRYRRCLIPVSGFYEWQAAEGGKRPWFLRLRSDRIEALARLWER